MQKCVECERDKIGNRFWIELLCGHNFDLKCLDRHTQLQNIYKISKDGHVVCLSLSQESEPPTCPTCQTPITDIRRYSASVQIKALPDNIDRMVAKMGRKMSYFEEGLVHKIQDMERDFAGFCKKIRPSPIAAKVNQRLVWERGESFMEVQRKVTSFRGKIDFDCRANSPMNI